MEPVVNRVAQSGIEVFDLSTFLPDLEPAVLDLAPFLVDGFVLREKDFREGVAATDWSAYAGRPVAITCSTDAIVPTWAWMLVASKLHGVADVVVMGRVDDAMRAHFDERLASVDWSRYRDGTVVVKGCGGTGVPETAYVTAMTALQRVARKVMFGEPCSTVPLWRRPRED